MAFKLKNKIFTKVIEGLGVFKLVVDNSSNGVVIFDVNGTVLYANRTALNIANLKAKKVINAKHNQVLRIVDSKTGKDLNGQIQKLVKAGVNRQNLNDNAVLLKSNGSTVAVSVSVIILKSNGKLLGGALILRDVTHEKEIERTKTEFVSLASHQLRTPLATVNWYAEMLLGGDAGKITPEQQQYIQEIYHGNQRMIELVNDLLNISRIDLGTILIKPEAVNFKELAESVWGEVLPQIKNKNITVVKKYDKIIPDIMLDSKLSRMICQNLLSNAVKYTPAKGKVSLTIKTDKTKLLMTVADSGIGIPKKQQDQIFTRLFRAENAKTKITEGTGLGLYIVKLAVEKFGGKVWFKSVENKGTTFYVSLPLRGLSRTTKKKTNKK